MGRQRSRAQRLRDLELEAELYVKGLTQRQIAERVGVSQTTICEDLEFIRERWIEAAVMDFNAMKAKELAKLDRIEREAWAAWDHTRRPDDDGVPRSGDPRYLAQIDRCVERRARLIGLNAPETSETRVRLDRPLLTLTDEELIATAATAGTVGSAGTVPTLSPGGSHAHDA